MKWPSSSYLVVLALVCMCSSALSPRRQERSVLAVIGILSSLWGILTILCTMHRHNNLALIGLLYVLLTCLGTCVFMGLHAADRDHFTGAVHDDSVMNSGLYFTVSTISTIGYGDIRPNTPLSRSAVMGFIILSMFINIFVIGGLFQRENYQNQ